MTIPRKKAEEQRTVQLEKQVLEGYNQFTVGENIPLVGKWIGRQLRRATEIVPIAQDFTAKVFEDFGGYLVDEQLENYGRFIVEQRHYVTPSATVEGIRACRQVYEADEQLRFGSYIQAVAHDGSLRVQLSIGHSGDQELVDLLKGADWSEKDAWMKSKDWALAKLKKQGVQGAADLSVAVLLRAIPLVAPLALTDLGRRIYNTAKIHAHWTLELVPKEGEKVTATQFAAYRALVDQYRK